MARLPSLFISHAAPDIVLAPGPAGLFWRDLGRELPRPEAILCVSAHWETDLPEVSVCDPQGLIHDYSGFDDRLQAYRYEPPGAPAVADRLQRLGIEGLQCVDRGLDHGAWNVLACMYPDADVPVTQLSLQTARGWQYHFDLGRKLRALRDEGVLILASGTLTHDLRVLWRYHGQRDAPPLDYAERFDLIAGKLVEAGNWAQLCDPERLPAFRRNHPSDEHYLPLLVAAGAGDGPGRTIHRSFRGAAFSMRCFAFD